MDHSKSTRSADLLPVNTLPAVLRRAARLGRPLHSLRGAAVADGLELLAGPVPTREAFFGALRRAPGLVGGGESFVLLRAPQSLTLADVPQAIRLAAGVGLDESLCIAVSRHHPDAAELLGSLHQAGLRGALADVDADTRFAEIGLSPACALLLDTGFVEQARRDLRAHTLLQAVATLGADLGLIGIAPQTSGDTEWLAQMGLDYVAGARIEADASFSGTSFEAPPSGSPTGYRDARYGR
jgi:hypothetical protein